MTTPLGVIPLLQPGLLDTLTKIEDIAAYIIQFSLLNPGFTSSINEGEMVSFRVLEATLGNNRQALASAYEVGLKQSIKRYVGDDSIQVTVTPYDTDDKTKYGLRIEVLNQLGDAIILRANAIVTDQNILDLKFNQ